MQLMTVGELRRTFHAGGLTAARVVASGANFNIVVVTKNGDKVILTRNLDAAIRAFGDIKTPLKLLRNIGFQIVTVNMANWQIDQRSL